MGLLTQMLVWRKLISNLVHFFVGKECQEKCKKVSEERGQEWITKKESQEGRQGSKIRERGEKLFYECSE